MEIPTGLTMLRYRMYSSAIYFLLSELSDTVNKLSSANPRKRAAMASSTSSNDIVVKQPRKVAQRAPGVSRPDAELLVADPGDAVDDVLVDETTGSKRAFRVTKPKPKKCVVQSVYALDLFCNIPQFIPRYGLRILPISEENCEESFNASNEAGTLLRSKVLLGLQDKKVRGKRLLAGLQLQNNGKRSTIPRIKHSMFPDIVFAPCVVKATDETVASRSHLPKDDPLRPHTVFQRASLRSANHLRRNFLLIENPIETGKSACTHPAAENTDVEFYPDSTVIVRLLDPLQKIATSSNLPETDTMVICMCGLHHHLSTRESQAHIANKDYNQGPSRFEYFHSAICVVLENYLLEHPADDFNQFTRLKLYLWAYLCSVASPTARSLFENESTLCEVLRSRHNYVSGSTSYVVPIEINAAASQLEEDVSNVMMTPMGGDSSLNIPSVAKLSVMKQRLELFHTFHQPAQVILRHSHIIPSSSTSNSSSIPCSLITSSSSEPFCMSSDVSNFRSVPLNVANAFLVSNRNINMPKASQIVARQHPLQLLFRYTDYRDRFPNCTWASFLNAMHVEDLSVAEDVVAKATIVPGHTKPIKIPITPVFVSPPHISKKPPYHVTGFWSLSEWRHLWNIHMLEWHRYYTTMPMVSHMNHYIAQERVKKLMKKRVTYDSLPRHAPYVELMRDQLHDRMTFYVNQYAKLESVARLDQKFVKIPPAMQTLIDVDLHQDTILGFHKPVSVDPFRCPYKEHKKLKFQNEDLLDQHLLIYHRLNPADDPVVTADSLDIDLSYNGIDDPTDEFECDFDDD